MNAVGIAFFSFTPASKYASQVGIAAATSAGSNGRPAFSYTSAR